MAEPFLPEWKLYLWKKLLLNKEKYDEGTISPYVFMFFDKDEQYGFLIGKSQKMIDSINYSSNLAVATKKPMKIGTGQHQSVDEDYYSCDPIRIMGALVELMDSTPQVLSITARLDKKYITHYREEKRAYEATQHKKHIAGISSNTASGSYKPNPKFMNDPFCGLGKAIYDKTEAGQTLTPDEFRTLAHVAQHTTHEFLHLELKIDKTALQAKLNTYIDAFDASNLVASLDVQYYEPNLQRTNVYSSIQSITKNFGTKNLQMTPLRIAECGNWTPEDEKHYRIFETLFSLEKTGEITINDLRKSEIILSLNDISENKKTPAWGRTYGSSAEEKQLLKNYYDGFIDLTNQHDFFVGLADYIEYVDSVPEFDRVTAELTKKRKECDDKLNELSTVAIVELDKIKTTFEDYVKKHAIQNDVIDNAFREYKSYKDGLARSSMPLVRTLHDSLADIVQELRKTPEHTEYASKYIQFWEHDAKSVKYYLPVKEVKDFEDTKEEYDELGKSELWGQINKLGLVYQTVKNGRSKHKELVGKMDSKDPKEKSWATFELVFGQNPLYGAWREIQNGKSVQGTLGGAFFNIAEIRPIAVRLNNYILSRATSPKVFEFPQTGKMSIEDFFDDEAPREAVEPPKKDEKIVANDASSSLKNENATNDTLTRQTSMQITLGTKEYRKAEYGCVQLFTRGERIILGKLDTRQYRLIKCLFNPENEAKGISYNPTFQGIDRVYENISLPKDKVNSGLKNNPQVEKRIIIEHTIKEVQKIKGLRGYIDFEWSPDKNKVRMNLHPKEGKK